MECRDEREVKLSGDFSLTDGLCGLFGLFGGRKDGETIWSDFRRDGERIGRDVRVSRNGEI